MSIFITLSNNPWFNSIKYQIIESNPIPKMNRSIDTKNAKYFQLYLNKAFQYIFNLWIFFSLLNSFINNNYKLSCFLNCQLSFCIHHRMNTSLQKFWFINVQHVKFFFIVLKKWFQWLYRSFHKQCPSLRSLQSVCTYSYEVSICWLCCDYTKFFVSLLLTLVNQS